jgi:Flagellar biosynthesis protein, FliO
MHRTQVAGKISDRGRRQESEGLAGWVLARLRQFRGVHTAERKEMRLVETLSLGGKRQLMLVECGGARYLVGGGFEAVQTIVPACDQTAAYLMNKDEGCQ